MATPTLITGTVPADSPLARLVGRTVALPARTPDEAAARLAEMRQAGIVPTRPVPWIPVAGVLTGAVLGALAAAIDAILAGDTADAWAAAGAMILLSLLLAPAVTRAELEADR